MTIGPGKKKKRRNLIDNSDIDSSLSNRSRQPDELRRMKTTDDLSLDTLNSDSTLRRISGISTRVDTSNPGRAPVDRSPRRLPDPRTAELSDLSRSQLTNLLRQEGASFPVLNQKELGAVLAGKTLPTFLLALQAQISDVSTFDRQLERLEAQQEQPDNVAAQLALTLDGAADLSVADLANVLPPPLTKAAHAALQDDKAILERSQRAIQNVLDLIGPTKEGDWITEAKIGALLASDKLGERDAGVEVMAALLDVSRSPKVIAACFEAAEILPPNSLQGNEVLNQDQLQTSFIKWSRASLTNVYFKSALMADLQTAVPTVPIGQYIANIGFNRLMSGENLLGASLSSDVDFKLVIDDVALARELPTYRTNETVESVNEKIRQVLRKTKKEFDAKFRLTLEVESFTVKTLSDVAKQMANSEQERNFSATVINNQTLMSGNPAVQKSYKDIISARVGNEIASRSWTQNLGESDKGSLEVIRSLPSFEDALRDIGKAVAADTQNLKVEAFRLMFGFEKFGDIIKENVRLGRTFSDVAADPNILKHLLKNDAFKRKLLAKREVINALNLVNMFGTNDNEKKIDLIAKLTANFTVDNNSVLGPDRQINNRKFIGRADVTENDEWVYSVKFSANRLYDTFDQTLVDDYVRAWGRNISEDQQTRLVQQYSGGRLIAEALNKFAVQVQDRIYDYQSEVRGATHEQIDDVYDRITASEFANILMRPHQKEAFLTSLKTLVTDLRTREPGVLPNMQRNLGNTLDTAESLVEQLSATSSFDELKMKKLGFQLFNTLSQMASITANTIKPKPIR
jgi:hypothetical protein